jgi:NitT/TauT family transport system substrate-binding protein
MGAHSRLGRKVLAGFALVALLEAGAASAQDIKVRIGASSNIAFGPNFVLDDRGLGIAAKHGLDVNVKIFATGVQSMEAALANEMDIAIMNTRVGLPLIATGKACFKGPVNFIAIPSVRAVGAMAMNGPKDLAGKKVGTVAGAVGNIALHLWLDKYGVPRDQVTVVNVSPPDMPIALAKGSVDAIIWTEPTPGQAIEMIGKDKVHYVGNISEAYRDVAPLNVTCNWYERYGDKGMEKLTAAWIEAVEFLKKNPQRAAEITGKRLQMDGANVLKLWQDGNWLKEGWPADLSDDEIDMYRLNGDYLVSIKELPQAPDLTKWISSKWLKAVAPERVHLKKYPNF